MRRNDLDRSPRNALERELERERQQHAINHDAKARLAADEDDRIKDARETANSSRVRR